MQAFVTRDKVTSRGPHFNTENGINQRLARFIYRTQNMNSFSAAFDFSRPTSFEEKYRLYIDESGDHVFREVTEIQHRFLCLLGCWFRNRNYLLFHAALESLKARYFPHHPDEPVVLHREDIVNARGAFRALLNAQIRRNFDDDLIQSLRVADFRIVAVVIDKAALRQSYGEAAADPYLLGLGFLLQRYVGYLNHSNRIGDVMAEARGGKEDRRLKKSYVHVYERGVWMTGGHVFQAGLSSREIKLKTKQANIAGLQLSDLLAHPVKQWVLQKYGLWEGALPPFSMRLMEVVVEKFNCHLYDGRVEGYGYVLYPKK